MEGPHSLAKILSKFLSLLLEEIAHGGLQDLDVLRQFQTPLVLLYPLSALTCRCLIDEKK